MDHPRPPISSLTLPTNKYYPKPPRITPIDSRNGNHGQKQGTLCPNPKTKSQSLHNKTTQSEKHPSNPHKLPSTSTTSKLDPKPPNTTLYESPHRSHVPKQGNPCPNSKTKGQPFPEKTTQPVQESPNPPFLSLTSPTSKSDPNLPFTNLCKSPHGSHGPKKRNPFPNSKNNSHPDPDERTHS